MNLLYMEQCKSQVLQFVSVTAAFNKVCLFKDAQSRWI